MSAWSIPSPCRLPENKPVGHKGALFLLLPLKYIKKYLKTKPKNQRYSASCPNPTQGHFQAGIGIRGHNVKPLTGNLLCATHCLGAPTR